MPMVTVPPDGKVIVLNPALLNSTVLNVHDEPPNAEVFLVDDVPVN